MLGNTSLQAFYALVKNKSRTFYSLVYEIVENAYVLCNLVENMGKQV